VSVSLPGCWRLEDGLEPGLGLGLKASTTEKIESGESRVGSRDVVIRDWATGQLGGPISQELSIPV